MPTGNDTASARRPPNDGGGGGGGGPIEQTSNRPKTRPTSPSAISTVSSESPLVRSGSSSSAASSVAAAGGAARRPAPTSIAAAQLRCQQQLQSAESNAAANNKLPNGNKLAAYLNAVAGSPRQANCAETPARAADWAARECQLQPARKAKAPKLAAGGNGDNNKGFGYNLAKSLAFRASRFNEFWSANKMRYMNLACLLMTLVCLLTILLFSGGGGSAPAAASPQQQALGSGGRHLFAAVHSRRASAPDRPLVESIESPNRRLVSDAPKTGAEESLSDQADDGNSFEDGFNFKLDERRDTQQAAASRGESGAGREVEETTTTSASPSTAQLDEEQTARKLQPTALFEAMFGGGNGLDGPPNKDAAEDEDEPLPDGLGQLLRALRGGQANSTGRPTILRRRSKNGAATIIISSGGSFGLSNETAPLNETAPSLPNLLEKLIPSMLLRPLNLIGNLERSALGKRPSGFATISINSAPAEQILDGNPLRVAQLSSSSPFAPFETIVSGSAPATSFMLPRRSLSASSPASFVFMAPPTRFMAPASFSPFDMPPLPPPGLMGMILRGAVAAAAKRNASEELPAKRNKTTSSLSAQASQAIQVNNLVAPSQQKGNATAEQKSNATAAADSVVADVETFDVGQLLRGARRSGPNSVFVISSSSSPLANPIQQMMFGGPQLDQLTPFGGHPLRAQPLSSAAPSPGQVSSILRAVLGNVVSDLALANGVEDRQRASRRAFSLGAAADDDDRDEAPSAKRSVRVSRVRPAVDSTSAPQASGDETAETPSQANGDLLAEAQHNSPQQHQAAIVEQLLESSGLAPAQQDGGFVSGTIKQTIRGPGVTVERIIELPRQVATASIERVSPGLRSQSLSRSDDEEDYDGVESFPAVRHAFPAPPPLVWSPFGRVFQESRPDSAAAADSAPPLPENNFFGRLFEDLRRSSPLAAELPAPPFPAQMMPRVSLISGSRIGRQQLLQDSDLDAGDARPSPKRIVRLFRKKVDSAPKAADLIESRIGNDDPLGESNKNAMRFDQYFEGRFIGDSGEQRQQQVLQDESPFASPSSPLFGLPSMAVTGNMAAAAAPSQPPKEANSVSQQQQNSQPQEERPPTRRAFVYHSNHEVSPAMQHFRRIAEEVEKLEDKKLDRSENGESGQSPVEERSFADKPQKLPPAAMAMGRRLDDGPFAADQQDSESNGAAADDSPSMNVQPNEKFLQPDEPQKEYKTLVI